MIALAATPELVSIDSLISLLTLTALEIILGIDNVIFVSIIMGRMPAEQRLKARRWWMVLGIGIRTVLLFLLGWLLQQKGKPVLWRFDLASLVMLAGGIFLLWKTVMEIHHKLEGDEESGPGKDQKVQTFSRAIFQIVLVDTVFSFDSVITASGIAKLLPIMITAVVIAMVIMFFFSERISNFIHKHPTLKMLALSFLVMVGMVLIVEGWDAERAHEMHLKNYVYFAMAFSFAVELLNMRMMRKTKRNPVKLKEPHVDDAGNMKEE
ncbi:MAG: TerC family protein [Flavipsychrobacter sp.]|nr:TerC family protein [Flavipsychrobacter sp.]